MKPILLFLIFSLVALAPAAAQTPVPADGVIASSGDYVLTANRTSAGLHNIKITANNVDLDLNGKIVQCSPAAPTTTTTFGVYANSTSGVIVRNGRIIGCQFGLHASYASNMTVTGVDFTGSRYVGVTLGGSGNRIIGNVFADIGGWASSAYSIGVNNPGPGSIIERNAFRNLYRQELAAPALTGEGVGVIVNAGGLNALIRDNVFHNDEPRQEENIGVWVAVNASAVIERNLFFNYDWAIGACCATVNRNVFWLEEGPGHWAIDVTEGSATRNLVVGWQDPWNGNVVDAGGNVVIDGDGS